MLINAVLTVCCAFVTTAIEVPPIPTNFHAVVNSSSQGILAQIVSFKEVYQDITNNRALIIGVSVGYIEKNSSPKNYLMVVGPSGAVPGSKEETEMTMFTINTKDGSCSYVVNDWPCKKPNIGIKQCYNPFGYPSFSTVGPWQLPDHVPQKYAGKETIEIHGRKVVADKWTEQVSAGPGPPDTVSYWVNASNNKIPLRYQHIHPHQNGFFPGDDWSYKVDFLKISFGIPQAGVFNPPVNWSEKCVDGNAGLLSTNLPGRQDGYLYTQPLQHGKFSLSLRTRPISKMPVIITITFCNSSVHSQYCVDDEVCSTCATIMPTKLEFTQDNWNKLQEVSALFNHVGVGQYKFSVSNNYPIHNNADSMQFSVFSCDPAHKVPCTLPP